MADLISDSGGEDKTKQQQQQFFGFGQIQTRLKRKYQGLLDQTTPFTGFRWAFTLTLAILYLIRVFIIGGFYIVTYAIGIYELNLFLLFLTPKVDLDDFDLDSDQDQQGPALPTKIDDEFRPFIRRLPEFKFWHSTTWAFLLGIMCTMIPYFNIPVFWPILLIYFVLLFAVMMRKRISHMIKHKYIPFTFGKPNFTKSSEK